jgi:hypothetical protein
MKTGAGIEKRDKPNRDLRDAPNIISFVVTFGQYLSKLMNGLLQKRDPDNKT